MRKDEKELFELVIQHRMQAQYERQTRKWKKKRECSPEIEEKYRNLVAALPPEQAGIIKAYEDDMVDFGGKENELFYRGGLEDGIRLHKMIRQMRKSV